MSDRRLEILKMVEAGQMSVEEGFRLLTELEQAQERVEIDAESEETVWPSPEPAPVSDMKLDEVVVADEPAGSRSEAPQDSPFDVKRMNRWKVWTWAGFGAAVLLTCLSALWMVQGWLERPFGWGFWLSWIPFLLGILGMLMTFNARWLHVRIRQKKGEKPQNINISLPLPLGFAAFILNTFDGVLPEEVRKANAGQILQEMDRSIRLDEPVHIEVNEKDGEHIEVYIG